VLGGMFMCTCVHPICVCSPSSRTDHRLTVWVWYGCGVFTACEVSGSSVLCGLMFCTCEAEISDYQAGCASEKIGLKCSLSFLESPLTRALASVLLLSTCLSRASIPE